MPRCRVFSVRANNRQFAGNCQRPERGGGSGVDLANSFALGFGAANTLPQSRLVDVYQEQDTFSASLGNHFVKFGFDLRQQKVDNFFLPNFLGSYRFRDDGTSASAITPNCQLCRFFTADARVRGGNATAFENLLLGRPERINFALGNPRIKTNQNDFFFFVQDNWRVRSNLALNLGIALRIFFNAV